MGIKYQNWEPGKGLEESQAKIFNENNPGGIPVAGKDIVARYEREKIDPKTVIYAMTEDGEMVAYIQARDYEQIKETHLGFPWALPNCPEGVQDKLFDNLLEYIKPHAAKIGYELRVNVNANRKDRIEFVKKRGLVKKDEAHRNDIDITKASAMEVGESKYTTRIATDDDMDLLIGLLKSEEQQPFNTDEEYVSYFKDRVFAQGNEGKVAKMPVMVFKDDELVTASAPLKFKFDEDERLIMRFFSIKKGHEEAYPLLMNNLGKICKKAGWTDIPLGVFLARDAPAVMVETVEKLEPTKVPTGLSFGLKD